MLNLFDVETRNMSEAKNHSVEMGRQTISAPTVIIQHTSWEKQVVHLRSSYEVAVAKLLDQDQIRYEVEAFRLKYYDSEKKKYRVAIPDFYLPDTNTLIEVKSSYWYDKPNMDCKVESYLRLGFKFRLWLDGSFVT